MQKTGLVAGFFMPEYDILKEMKAFLFLCLIVAGAYFYLSDSSVSTRAGSLMSARPHASAANVSQQPQQTDLSGSTTIPFSNGKLTLLAEYEITARILGTERYSMDWGSKLAPIDLALGWGVMSQPSVYKKLNITQSNRWYHYRWNGNPPADPAQIVSSSANVHIIPANDSVKKAVFALDEDQIVTLKGYLVYYKEGNAQAWRDWRSSLNRHDSGEGSCEVFYVEHVIGH